MKYYSKYFYFYIHYSYNIINFFIYLLLLSVHQFFHIFISLSNICYNYYIFLHLFHYAHLYTSIEYHHYKIMLMMLYPFYNLIMFTQIDLYLYLFIIYTVSNMDSFLLSNGSNFFIYWLFLYIYILWNLNIFIEILDWT